MVYKNTLRGVASDSKEIVSMSYVCTAFSLGTTFISWYFIHSLNALGVVSGTPFVIMSWIYLFTSFQRFFIGVESSLLSIASMYLLTTGSLGFIASVLVETFLQEFGSPLVLVAVFVSFVTFLTCAYMGHKSNINEFAKMALIRAMVFVGCVSTLCMFIVSLFLPSLWDTVSLVSAYISAPITMFFIFSISNTIKNLADNGLEVSRSGEAVQVRNARIAMLCSICIFSCAIQLLFYVLRILSAGNRRRD